MTDKKISKISDVKPEVNEDLIRLISRYLEEAKSGELQGAAIAGVYNNDSDTGGAEFGGKYTLLLGSLRKLDADLLTFREEY